MTDKKNQQDGFTLLELLVALTIFSIVIVSAIRNNSAIIENTAYLKKKNIAHWVAMNKAAELRLSRHWVTGEGEEGQLVMAGRTWSWQVHGKTTPDPDVQLISISVAEEDSSKGVNSPLVTLSVYLGRPEGYT